MKHVKDVSDNEIMSLGSEMSELKNLTFLNASNNKLTKAFDWGTDTVLTEVNFSNNKIEELVKLRRQKSLRKLDLSMNHVPDVRGLDQCRQLQSLNLSHNEIRSAEGLDHLPLFDLNLANNKMETIQGRDPQTACFVDWTVQDRPRISNFNRTVWCLSVDP